MGSIIYDFLMESILFNNTHVEDNYASIPETELQKELDRYREFVILNFEHLQTEVTRDQNSLRVFGTTDFLSIKNIMQTAWYLEQVVIPDPIFPLTSPMSDFSRTAGLALGIENSPDIDRQKLATASKRMKILTPMVAADFVKFFPVSYFSEPQTQIPITYPKNAFTDALPPDILKVYQDNALVRTLIKTNDGHLIVKPNLEIGRGIAITFNKDITNQIQFYHLHEPKILEINDDDRTMNIALTLPDEPPSQEQFTHWVFQSINQTALSHYKELSLGLSLATTTGASFITNSEFTHTLLGSQSSHDDITQYSAECILNLELPILTDVNMTDLMRVRQEDGEAFEIFRKELEARFRELRLETDPDKAKFKIQNAFHELGELQYTKIDQKFKSLRKGVLAETGMAVAGLAGSVATSGASILATITALAAGYKTYRDYRKHIKENPAYFLWKVKGSKNKK